MYMTLLLQFNYNNNNLNKYPKNKSSAGGVLPASTKVKVIYMPQE